jgi:hypothetical protein
LIDAARGGELRDGGGALLEQLSRLETLPGLATLGGDRA